MKPAFKVLFSNDTVNTVNCTSPYHAAGEPFTQAMLEASVDETLNTGIDVHMLQPGLTVVPWWQSKQYPYEEHIRWYEQTYQTTVADNPYYAYMMNGGDMVAAFVQRCREGGILPFVSLRLNDSHGKEFVDTMGGGEIVEIPGYALHCVNRFYKDHAEYRIDPEHVDKAHWDTRVLNWSNPEVVEWMFGFIREICENYAIAGLELDFMRHSNYFRQNETTFAERSAIMTGFVRRVRKLLDRTAKPGEHRWLGARLPCYVETYDELGIDLGALVGDGLEIVNLSCHYHTLQQADVALVRRMAGPDVSVHLELTHSVMNVGKVPGAYDATLFLRSTDLQLQTAAHLAYARGADGVSAFNFAYFREFGAPGRGPFNEPPFELFKHLRDPVFLAKQPQHYYMAATTGWAVNRGQRAALPLRLHAGARGVLVLDMAPVQGGWSHSGRLRVRAREDLGDATLQLRFNGRLLAETADRSELYQTRYAEAHHPAPEKHRAWVLDAALAADGDNLIEILVERSAETVTIEYLDLSLA